MKRGKQCEGSHFNLNLKWSSWCSPVDCGMSIEFASDARLPRRLQPTSGSQYDVHSNPTSQSRSSENVILESIMVHFLLPHASPCHNLAFTLPARKLRVVLILLVIILSVGPTFQIQGEEKSSPYSTGFSWDQFFQKNDRVVLLGGTFIERAQQFGYLEFALTTMTTHKHIQFRNLGWSGDTIWAESRGIFDQPQKGYQKLLKHLNEWKPTVLLMAWGFNESYAGEQGLASFEAQYLKLLQDVKPLNCRILLVTPHLQETAENHQQKDHHGSTVFQHHGTEIPLNVLEVNNQRLKLYAERIKNIGVKQKLPVLDLSDQKSFSALLTTKTDLSKPFTNNGMHLNSAGYYRFGKWLRDTHFHPVDHEWLIDLNQQKGEKSAKLISERGLHLTNIQKTGNSYQIRFTQPLPFPNSEVMGKQPQQTKQIKLKIQGLMPGEYSLKIDGAKRNLSGTHAEWEKGIEVVIPRNSTQAKQLREAIIRKNELYFHRWRPQNITYLYLFRKHEQGQNAKEVLQFDQLVKEQEVLIEQLKQPREQSIELVKQPS